MRSMKKLKTSLVLLLLINFTSISIAAPGKYKQVEQGDTVPFAGWCFDKDASAQILADMRYEVDTRDTTIEALKKENLKLEQVIIDSSNTHWHVFASLGFVAGVVLTVVIVETVR